MWGLLTWNVSFPVGHKTLKKSQNLHAIPYHIKYFYHLESNHKNQSWSENNTGWVSDWKHYILISHWKCPKVQTCFIWFFSQSYLIRCFGKPSMNTVLLKWLALVILHQRCTSIQLEMAMIEQYVEKTQKYVNQEM